MNCPPRDSAWPSRPQPSAVLPWVTAGIALVVGLAVYLLARPAGHAALLPAAWSAAAAPGLFGALGGWWPSYAHPFAFSLLSHACRADARRSAWGLCAAWWALNVVFEMGQHPAVAPKATAALRAAFGVEGFGAALSRPVAAFLLRGTFDLGDLAAATLGALSAAALIARTATQRAGHGV